LRLRSSARTTAVYRPVLYTISCNFQLMSPTVNEMILLCYRNSNPSCLFMKMKDYFVPIFSYSGANIYNSFYAHLNELWNLFIFPNERYFVCYLLTANDKTLTKNAQAARNHWNLHTDNGISSSSLCIANKLTIEMGMTTIVTIKSVNPTFTIRLLPAIKFII
jgi:hypothetical protein